MATRSNHIDSLQGHNTLPSDRGREITDKASRKDYSDNQKRTQHVFRLVF